MKWNEVKGTLAIMGAVFALMVAGGAVAFFYGRTLVEWWLPLTISLCAALLLWVLLKEKWARRWPDTYGWLRCALHFLYATVLSGALLLGVNFAAADDATLHDEPVEVLRKYRTKHHRSRRVGRNRYAKGEPYYKYKFDARFADGRVKTLEVPLKRYNTLRQGSTIGLPLETGLFGWPVIESRPAARR